MEEKNKKVSISTILLILTIIAMIVMGVFMYKLYNDKKAEIEKSTELQGTIADLNSTISELQGKINSISDTINNDNSNTTSNGTQNNSNTSSNDNSKDYEDIILNGSYDVPNSDVGFEFSKDGKAMFFTNLGGAEGTYRTTGKDNIEAHYTRSEVLNEETNERTISDIDEYEHFIVEDNGDVFWINSNGDKVQLMVYGEVDKR